MERPRRNPRPPGTLSDYLTVGEAESRNICVEKNTVKQEKEEEEMKPKDTNQLNADKKLLLSQPYKCGECKARYRSRVALLRHAVKHSGETMLFFNALQTREPCLYHLYRNAWNTTFTMKFLKF